jgi:hypothetical protein
MHVYAIRLLSQCLSSALGKAIRPLVKRFCGRNIEE